MFPPVPPIPPWEGLHPIVVHFPIALLLVAPLFIVLALVWQQHRQAFFLSALVLMGIGTLSAIITVESGEAAGQIAFFENNEEAGRQVLVEHAELAEQTRNIFAVLTVLYAGLIFLPRLLKRDWKTMTTLVIHGIFLLIYSFGMLSISATGHLGGRLVHEFGLQAMMGG